MPNTPEDKSPGRDDGFMMDIEIDGLMEYVQSADIDAVVFSKELFDEELAAADISPEIRNAVRDAIQETEAEQHSVMFIATDGDLAIKAIHVPKSAIMGADGPVLFAGADGHTVIAAWSKEFIEEQLEIINKKTGERAQTYLAKVAIPFNGDFVNLLNLEWQGSKIETLDRLNELIKTDEFLAVHREALTLVGPRIPNDATNTIEAFEVWHFVDASVLNTIIVPTELVAKSGADFDGDKLFLTMPHIDKKGKVVNTGPASYSDFVKEYERSEERRVGKEC